MPPLPPNAPDSGPTTPPVGPASAPMSTPTEHEGLKAQAMQGVQLAIKLLEAALLPFGVQSPEGKRLMTAINSLGKMAGSPGGGPDLNQAQVKMLAAQAGPEGAGGAPKPPMPAGGAGGPGGMPMAGPSPMGI